MANPIYKFDLSAEVSGSVITQRAYPIYKDDLSIDYEHPSGQEFFQRKLNGKLCFVESDYTFIANKAFDTQFGIVVYISYDLGTSWSSYWSGKFFKTDCEFDDDNKTCFVTPEVDDLYNIVLAGLEKEFDLIQLKPEIEQVVLDKRPLIQIYVPGKDVVGCFLSNMWWEQECGIVEESETINIGGLEYSKLQYYYHFSFNKAIRQCFVSGSPLIPDLFWGTRASNVVSDNYSYSKDGYTFSYVWSQSGNIVYVAWRIIRDSDSSILWRYEYNGVNPPRDPAQVTLSPVSGSGVSGNLTVNFVDIPVYARFICDVDEITAGLSTYDIPLDDFVWDNRNYHKCVGYNLPDTIGFTDVLTTTPTEWGIYQPGEYYQPPYVLWSPQWFPICRDTWNRVSVWFTEYSLDWIIEEKARKPYLLKHTYPVWSVISVLLKEIAPGVTHFATPDYSEFLYDTNPLSSINQNLLISPKSNLVSAGYDQPAQKAPITLKRVLDMLRDCFRCYWFIDSQGKFRIEHIRYFMLGGSYTGTPIVGTDLTIEEVTRNGKKWAFEQNQYSFDKPEMTSRYQFGWMDDVTQLFEGSPIDIVSKYVSPSNIEETTVSQFTSDIDYILLNPSEISKDGFVLLSAVNNYDTLSTTIDSYIRQDGVEISSNVYHSTDFVPVQAGGFINYSGFTGQTMCAIAGYDSDDNFIEVILGGGTYTNKTVRVPSGISSIRACGLGSGASVSLNVKYSQNLSLPYVNFSLNNTDHILQNAYVAFVYLQRYYIYDMPARTYSINGIQQTAIGIKKLKTQNVRFPLLNDPDTLKLVKTNIGNGVIQKLSINLLSRNANATLRYDTE